MENPKQAKVYEPLELICIEEECGHAKFIFTPGEQEYFAALTEKTGQQFVPPRRCHVCRLKRKTAKNYTIKR